jgi:multisubunit Na+/H+ antiporter MnhG subunit
MDPHTIVVLVLLGLAALTVVLSAVGLLRTPDPLGRLHFLTPVTSVAAPLVGLSYWVDEGMGLAAGLVLLVVGLLALTGPPLSSAIARATAEEEELLPSEQTG